MTYQELVKNVAEVCNFSQTAIDDLVRATAYAIAAELVEGGEVSLPALGKLVAVQKAARTGRNPQTGEALSIPARTTVKFKACKALTEALNG